MAKSKENKNKFEPISLTLGVLICFIYCIVTSRMNDGVYFLAYFTPTLLVLMVPSFIIALICKCSKKVFSISFLILTSIFVFLQYNMYVSHKQYLQEKGSRIQNQAVKAVSSKDLNEFLENTQGIEDEIIRESYEYTGKAFANKFQQYLKETGLEGIITQDNYQLLQSKEGISQLYLRAQKVIKGVNNVNIPEDVNNIMEDCVKEYEQICYQKHPNETRKCFVATQGSLNGIKKSSIEKMQEVLLKKKDLILNYEYPAINCFYSGTQKCDKLINDFINEEAKLRQLSEQAQLQIQESAIKSISGTP